MKTQLLLLVFTFLPALVVAQVDYTLIEGEWIEKGNRSTTMEFVFGNTETDWGEDDTLKALTGTLNMHVKDIVKNYEFALNYWEGGNILWMITGVELSSVKVIEIKEKQLILDWDGYRQKFRRKKSEK